MSRQTKRPAPPTRHPPEYPSAVEAELSRRWFLQSALTGGATVAVAAAGVAGVGLLAEVDDAEARGRRGAHRKRRPKHEVRFSFRSLYTFRHSNYRYEKIVVGTDSDRLAAFLKDPKEALGLEKALRKVLDRHTCADLVSGKRLARLQARLAKIVAAHYHKRRRRRVAAPTVALFVGVRYHACRGKCAPPTPYCNAPRPRPRRRR